MTQTKLTLQALQVPDALTYTQTTLGSTTIGATPVTVVTAPTYTPKVNCHAIIDGQGNYNGNSGGSYIAQVINVNTVDQDASYAQQSNQAVPITCNSMCVVALTAGTTYTFSLKTSVATGTITINNNRATLRVQIVN